MLAFDPEYLPGFRCELRIEPHSKISGRPLTSYRDEWVTIEAVAGSGVYISHGYDGVKLNKPQFVPWSDVLSLTSARSTERHTGAAITGGVTVAGRR